MRFRYDKESEELVISDATRIEYHQMDIWLTRHVKGYRFNPAFKMGVWNGKESYFKNGRINFGLWKECMMGCQEIGSKFILDNKEEFPINREVTLESVNEFCKDFFKDHKRKNESGEWVSFFPYDHQIESAYKILRNRYCLAEVATSGGKTLIISIVYFYTLSKINLDAKLLIIVPSITLVTQFYDSIVDFNIGLNKKFDGGNKNPHKLVIEEVMSDRPRKHGNEVDPNVYIGTYQSLEKWPKEFFKQFHTIAVDESHGAKSATLKSILKKTFKSAYSRFGVSGTFPPEDSCEILTIQSVLGPKITEVSASELKEKGIITPMEIRAIIMNHNDPNFDKMMKDIKKMGGGKDALNLEKVFIQNSEKRLDLIKKIADKCSKNSLILFHTIEYGQKIFNKLKNDFPDREVLYIDGSIKNRDREEIKAKMELSDGKIRILVASFGTLSTGVSISNLHYLFLCDSFKSEQIVVQSIGRLLRLFADKSKAVIFDFVDVFVQENPRNILYNHYVERQKFYKKRKYPFVEKKINLN